jgi:hypothetical protein
MVYDTGTPFEFVTVDIDLAPPGVLDSDMVSRNGGVNMLPFVLHRAQLPRESHGASLWHARALSLARSL